MAGQYLFNGLSVLLNGSVLGVVIHQEKGWVEERDYSSALFCGCLVQMLLAFEPPEPGLTAVPVLISLLSNGEAMLTGGALLALSFSVQPCP